jgi:hypothetical protein
MKPIARWTIGNTTQLGYESLLLSIASFRHWYDIDAIIFNNGLSENLNYVRKIYPEIPIFQQPVDQKPAPVGVTWKLYPPRMDISRHEIFIDNDIVFTGYIPEIDYFFENDCTLLLEDVGRAYGKFDKHVPKGYNINSGIFGLPPNFNLKKYIDMYVDEWEINASGAHAASKTFDEQGIVAFALLNHPNFVIIDNETVTDCRSVLKWAKGMHFIGINRCPYHSAFQLFKSNFKKIY